jgi:hypothetical protein
MAIKITTAGLMPAVELEYVQIDKFSMAISRAAPARIAMTANISLYGVDTDGIKQYHPDQHNLSIRDLNEFVGTLDPADQVEAAGAIAMVEEGLGILADKYFGWNFVQVE